MTHKVAIIAGVGPGLGSSLARACVTEGLTVVAAARSASTLTDLQNEIGKDRLLLHDCDVTSADDVLALLAFSDGLGSLDLTIFNAGAFKQGSVIDTDVSDFEQCWRVGCLGGFLIGQQAARRMVDQQHGTIIFTGATASLRGGAGFANLASPKFALRALAQSMARELGPKGVHIAHTIIDGQIASKRYAELLEERGPDALLEPDQIAEAYMALHRQRRNAWTFELDLRPWVEKF